MKVAFFQPYLANWRIEFLENFVSKTSHEVIVYDGGYAPKKDFKSISGNPTKLSILRMKSWSPTISYRSQAYPIYFSPSLILSLIRDRPDCIVTEGEINFINNFSVWIYCFFFGKRYIWWSLGKVRTRKPNVINKVFDPFVNFLLNRASCIMARNTLAKKYYCEAKGVSPAKIVVAPNSMDEKRAISEITSFSLELIEEKAESKVVLFVGALTKEKRPADLLHALDQIRQAGRNDVRLWFVGAGPEREYLESLALELGLSSWVKFCGKVFRGVADYFVAADVVAVPGLGGLVINHAMIFSKPVVSRLADGTELDLIENGINGYLLEGYSNPELASAVMSVLDSPKYEEMCRAAGDVVKLSWNMDLMISRVHECIDIATRYKTK